MRPHKLLSLPKKEKEILEALLCDEKDAKQWRRYKAVLLCCENIRGEVAKTMGTTESNVGILVRTYQKQGISGLKIKKQSGRPSKISERNKKKLERIIDSNSYGWSTKQVRELIHKETGILYCKRQVYRIAQMWGFSQVSPRPKHKRQASRSTIYRFKKSETKT